MPRRSPISGATSPSHGPPPRPSWASSIPTPWRMRRRTSPCPGASRRSTTSSCSTARTTRPGWRRSPRRCQGGCGTGRWSGRRAAAEGLPGFLRDRRLAAVMAILDDKAPAAMLRELLPLCDQVVFCRIANPRALSPATLSSLAGQVGGIGADRVHTARDARDAVELARELAGRDGIVLATGSIYLLADLLRPANAGPGATL